MCPTALPKCDLPISLPANPTVVVRNQNKVMKKPFEWPPKSETKKFQQTPGQTRQQTNKQMNSKITTLYQTSSHGFAPVFSVSCGFVFSCFPGRIKPTNSFFSLHISETRFHYLRLILDDFQPFPKISALVFGDIFDNKNFEIVVWERTKITMLCSSLDSSTPNHDPPRAMPQP